MGCPTPAQRSAGPPAESVRNLPEDHGPVSSSQSGCDLQLSLVGAGGIEPPTSAL